MMVFVSELSDAYVVPRVPVSVGALIFDADGRLLVLKPNYKSGWTIPGGQMDAGGESPWEACRRETREECGLQVVSGRLVCVDFRPAGPTRLGGVRLLFHCGSFSDRQLAGITLQSEEIDDHRLAEPDEALALLRAPIRRRVAVGITAERCVYLEDGRPVAAVAG